MTSLVTLRLDANGNMVTDRPAARRHQDASAWMFEGKINPGQLQIVREITTAGADAVADIDTARFQGGRGEYAFSATADGQVIVTACDRGLARRHRPAAQHRAGAVRRRQRRSTSSSARPATTSLNGTAQDDLILGLAGADMLNGGGGQRHPGRRRRRHARRRRRTYADNFDSRQLTATPTARRTSDRDWVETNDSGGTDRRSDPHRRRQQQRPALPRRRRYRTATARRSRARSTSPARPRPRISFDYDADRPRCRRDRHGRSSRRTASTSVTLEHDRQRNGTGTELHRTLLTRAVRGERRDPLRRRRHRTTDENVSIDNLVDQLHDRHLTAGVDTLNGGLGDDTYSFTLGDGNDIINEASAPPAAARRIASRSWRRAPGSIR